LPNARSSSSTRPGDASFRAVFVVAAVIAVMYLAREVFIPLAFASLLGMIWTPPVLWLQKRGFHRVISVMLVAACSLAAAGGAAWVIGNQLMGVVSSLPNYQQNIHNKIAALGAAGKGSLSRAAENVQSLGKEFSAAGSGPPAAPAGSRKAPSSPVMPVPVQIAQPAPNPIQYLETFAVQFVRPLGAAILVLVFSIFLVIERQSVRNRFLRLVGLGQLSVMTQALDDAARRLSRYFLLQFAVNAGFGCIIGLGLYLIGLPYAALWGAVAALFRIVPYVGTLTAAALPALLSIAAFNTWTPILWVAALFLGIDLLVANWLEPRLYGSHTGVSPLAILVTTVFWTILWGPAGLILSTPLTVCVVVFGRYVPQLAFLHILLGDEPVLAAETQLYQRLLAMDREEAEGIAELFLKQHSLLDLYNSVMLPALAMAEQDRHRGALDGTREEFVFLSIKEMIAEFATYAPQPGDAAREEQQGLEDAACENTTLEPANLEKGPAVPIGRVLCLAASDEADEIAASMLTQLLEERGVSALAFPSSTSSLKALTFLKPQPNDAICVSALPPFAFAPARALARQLRSKFPKTRILVCIWGLAAEPENALQRFEAPRPERIMTSLLGAVEYFKPGTSAVKAA
jgi:predicted PurR-regulated permease PerM